MSMHAGETDRPGRSPATILRAITRLNIGGPARQALLLSKRLEPSYRTILAAGRPPRHEGELLDPTVPVERVPLVRPVRPAQDMAAVAAARGLIIRNGAVLVHTHMAKAGMAGRVAASLVRPRPRTVHTFHGHVLDGYFSKPVARAFIAAERALARRSDVLIAVSPEIRDDLLDLGIGRASQYRVIPLGFDLSQLVAVTGQSGALRGRLNLPPHTPLVVTLGRLTAIKDHRTLIEAVGRVEGVHLSILGDGELRGELEALVADLHLHERVHFTGWWEDVASAVADADVVALASRNEGTPVALIEASAAGRPVVSTSVGGVKSVVKDGQTGLLTPAGDPASLAAALHRLLSEPALRQQMGQAGRRHVTSLFGQERLIADIRALYDELLGGG